MKHVFHADELLIVEHVPPLRASHALSAKGVVRGTDGIGDNIQVKGGCLPNPVAVSGRRCQRNNPEPRGGGDA